MTLAHSAAGTKPQNVVGSPDGSAAKAQEWLKGIRVVHVAQSRAAAYYSQRSRGLGLAVTLLSALAGTSLFAGLSSSSFTTVAIVAGGVSAIVAVLSAAQTFLNYGELSQKAHAASLKYGTLRREFEEGLVFATDEGKRQALMDKVWKEWDQVDQEAPTIPNRIYNDSLNYVDERLRMKSSTSPAK